MFWTVLFFFFLLAVFLLFLKLSSFTLHGKQILKLPLRLGLAFLLPFLLVLVALVSSFFLLLSIAFVFIVLLLLFILFLIGKVRYHSQRSGNTLIIQTEKKK